MITGGISERKWYGLLQKDKRREDAARYTFILNGASVNKDSARNAGGIHYKIYYGFFVSCKVLTLPSGKPCTRRK